MPLKFVEPEAPKYEVWYLLQDRYQGKPSFVSKQEALNFLVKLKKKPDLVEARLYRVSNRLSYHNEDIDPRRSL